MKIKITQSCDPRSHRNSHVRYLVKLHIHKAETRLDTLKPTQANNIDLYVSGYFDT